MLALPTSLAAGATDYIRGHQERHVRPWLVLRWRQWRRAMCPTCSSEPSGQRTQVLFHRIEPASPRIAAELMPLTVTHGNRRATTSPADKNRRNKHLNQMPKCSIGASDAWETCSHYLSSQRSRYACKRMAQTQNEASMEPANAPRALLPQIRGKLHKDPHEQACLASKPPCG